MYVCICKAISDHDIRQAVAEGISTWGELRERLSVAARCGRCTDCAKTCLDEALQEQGERCRNAA